MQKENLDFLIFNTVEFIEDAKDYGLVAGKMYYIIDYSVKDSPLIILDNGDLFEVLPEELEYAVVNYGDIKAELESEEEELIEKLKEITATTKENVQLVDYTLSKYKAPVNLYDRSHNLNDKEVAKISKWLDDLALENAINYSIENNDRTAFEKLGKVLRRNKFKDA